MPSTPPESTTREPFGLAVALVGAALVLVLYLRGQPQTVQVLKAAHDLPPGTVLQAGDLVAETEPLSDGLSMLVVPASDRDAVVGHPLGDGLMRGLPLARAQVLDTSRRIPDNPRVVALPITPEAAAGGQIVPGNDVEILATLKKPTGEQANTVTVAARVTVYAVGGQSQASTFGTADRTSASGIPLSWLSVLADTDQARAIASARTASDLQVNLLPPAHALGMITDVEVIGAHTQTNAAALQHIGVRRYRTNGLLVHPPVGVTGHAEIGKQGVAFGAHGTLPHPVIANAVDVSPEQLEQRGHRPPSSPPVVIGWSKQQESRPEWPPGRLF